MVSNMDDLVSIIMPNYNCEKYLNETLDSVVNQTYTNWELLIVDDCSTDNSISIIEDFKKNDSRIKLFINEKNSGAAYSRNIAINAANGIWIAFLDSDDIWYTTKLEKQIKFMKSNNYSFSYTKYIQIDEDSNNLNICVTGPKIVSKYKMYRYNYIGCLTVIYRKDKIGIIQIDPNLKSRNDYAIWLKVIKKSKCYLLDENLAKHRKRKGTLSHTGLKKSIKNQYKMYRLSEKMNPINSFIHTIRNLFWGYLKKMIYNKKNN